jgi:integrase
MAWLEEHPTSGHFKVCFRWNGRKHKKTFKTTSKKDAEAALARFEENVSLLERGRIELPPGADVGTFLLSDGKLTGKPGTAAPPAPALLGELQGRYAETLGNGAVEENSLDTVRMHLRHFLATLGERFPLQGLTLADLQRHVDRRAKKRYRGKPLSPVTIRKEMATLRALWNWGVHGRQLHGPFPGRGLKYPKADEKPPFQTREEIERRVASGGLTPGKVRELWDCLYLRVHEIEELLEDVRASGTQPWVYPLFCTAAHTGARRSELLRIEIPDLDFDAGTILIHEKKRARGKRTTRRVTMTPFLKGVLQGWLAVHPGGPRLFAQAAKVVRSKTRRTAPTPVTRDEAHDHFKRTVAGSKWAVLRGYHCLRHSFISCLAARGVDQRLIDDLVGHQTEEQRRRYRHLAPDLKREALKVVFG